jgi:hypothetical protein
MIYLLNISSENDKELEIFGWLILFCPLNIITQFKTNFLDFFHRLLNEIVNTTLTLADST